MNIRITAKDAECNDFYANMTPKKNAKIDLDQIKQAFQKMGLTNVVVKYGKQEAK